MMKNRCFILICCLLGTTLAWAQLPPYHPNDQLYNEAVELFEKGIYGQAIKKVDAFLEAEALNDGRSQQGNDLRVNARYMQAVSAYHLQRSNAVNLLESFAIRYEDNSKATLTRYYLGKYYFEKQDFRQAITPLLACYTRNALDKERYDEVIFMLGYAYFIENQYDRAVRFFELAAASDNKYQEDAQYYQGVLLYQDGKYEQAYQALNALQDSPKYKDETRVYLANTLYKLKRYDELFGIADQMLRDRRKRPDPEVYLIVANASYEKTDYPKALQYFGEYERTKGKKLSRTSYFRYAFAHYKRGDCDKAIPLFEKVLTANDSLQQMASYYMGFCFLQKGDQRSARFAFEKAKEPVANSNPDITEDALYQYAKVCFATQEYEKALKALRQLEENYPAAAYNSEIKSMIGELLLLSKDYAASIEYLETNGLSSSRAKKAYQTAAFYYGLELFEKNDYERAIVYLQKAAESSFDPEVSLSAKYWIAEAEFRRGNYAAAEAAYLQYRNSPGASSHTYYGAASYGLAWTYFKQKQYSKAAREFDNFIRSGSRNAPQRYLADAYLRAGDSYFLMRNYAKANTYYNQVAENDKFPQRDYALYQIAEGYYRMGQYTRSVQTFDRMIRTFTKSEYRDNALDRISEVYATWIKDYAQAAKYSRMLVNEYPRSPLAADAYNRLAFTAYNMGDERAAINYFKKVLTDYTYDQKNAKIALDNLASLLPASEFDDVLEAYRNKNPELDENLAELAFTTGQDRFFEMNYESAIRQFTTYIQDFPNGPNYFEALIYRARSYKALNRLDLALRDYQAVYSPTVRNPFTSTALLEAAEIKFEQLDYGASLKLYQELRATADAQQNRIQADFGIAKCYKAMGDYRQAMAVLEGITTNPEATLYAVNKAKVEIGECQYYLGDLDGALRTFSEIEAENKDQFGEQSQYWITQILYDKGQYEAAKDAALYLKQTYPSDSYWRAKAFLVVADADYALGNTFQAKGVLESLINEAPFDDIKQQAREKLDKILEEERQAEGASVPNNDGNN